MRFSFLNGFISKQNESGAEKIHRCVDFEKDFHDLN